MIKHIGNTFLEELSNDEHIDTLNFNQYGIKTPTHVDIRSGLIYLSPVGMESDDNYRNLFVEYDNKTNWRKLMISILAENTKNTGLVYTIGGSVGIACYPETWDKSQVVQYVKYEEFNKIYFFGDKTEPNGNDYPLYNSPHVIGYSVDNPGDTLRFLKELFIKN
jgi:phosphomannomutase